MAEKRRRVAIAVGLVRAGDWRREMYAGIQRYARETGRWEYTIDEAPEHAFGGESGGRRAYDGVLARTDAALAKVLKFWGIPVVNLWHGSSVAAELPGVFPDFKAVGRLCAEHLVGRGFQRFGCVAPHTDGLWRLVLDAFMAGVLDAGNGVHFMIHSDTERLLGDPAQMARATEIISRWLDNMTPPVGLFMMSAAGAMQLANICAARGWRVPEDVGIMSATDDISMCEHTIPALSSIDKNYGRVGYEAAQMLDRLMDGEPASPEHILVPPAGVVARASTDFLAVEDSLVADALRFIAENLARGIDVHDVVEGVGTSASTLARGFRKHVGRAMSEEIRRLRLEAVKRMLAEPEKWGLDAIAAKAGFRGAGMLCRVFRRELGMTPGQYRVEALSEKG